MLVQLRLEVPTSKSRVDLDNIFTSVVSECGTDQLQEDQENQVQEPMQEEKLDSDLLDRVQFTLDGDLAIQSRLMLGETDLETEPSLPASILRMIDVEHGGLVISKVLTTSDWSKS